MDLVYVGHEFKVEKVIDPGQIKAKVIDGSLGLYRYFLRGVSPEQERSLEKYKLKAFSFVVSSVPRMDDKANVFYLTEHEDIVMAVPEPADCETLQTEVSWQPTKRKNLSEVRIGVAPSASKSG